MKARADRSLHLGLGSHLVPLRLCFFFFERKIMFNSWFLFSFLLDFFDLFVGSFQFVVCFCNF